MGCYLARCHSHIAGFGQMGPLKDHADATDYLFVASILGYTDRLLAAMSAEAKQPLRYPTYV